MSKLENYEVTGWEHAIRGMRNPMNSWEKSDSEQIESVMKTKEISPDAVQTHDEFLELCGKEIRSGRYPWGYDKDPYPMNSLDKSDSVYGTYWGDIDGHKCFDSEGFSIGQNDHDLMMRLRNAGTDHRKFMRMITVYVDITAPLYW